MKNYRVTIYFSKTYEVEAGSENEAEDKAHKKFVSSFNSIPIPDEYEVECLDEEEDED